MVSLVILDAFFVLAELLIDLSVIKLEEGHIAPEVRPPTRLPLFIQTIFYSSDLLKRAFVLPDFSLPELGSTDLFHGGAGW